MYFTLQCSHTFAESVHTNMHITSSGKMDWGGEEEEGFESKACVFG